MWGDDGGRRENCRARLTRLTIGCVWRHGERWRLCRCGHRRQAQPSRTPRETLGVAGAHCRPGQPLSSPVVPPRVRDHVGAQGQPDVIDHHGTRAREHHAQEQGQQTAGEAGPRRWRCTSGRLALVQPVAHLVARLFEVRARAASSRPATGSCRRPTRSPPGPALRGPGVPSPDASPCPSCDAPSAARRESTLKTAATRRHRPWRK